MSMDNLITPEGLAKSLKMAAEGMKNKPGLMKSTVGYMELLNTYVERIATAKDRGKFVVTHGTQQPLEIYEAMDVVGVFNEFWGVISDWETACRFWPDIHRRRGSPTGSPCRHRKRGRR
ncbi:hypothetical protein [Sinorhizobium medicae]|uniref:hypothetical protein n=1 Tax=Sinorhizobium medicae TaxID=110321 RepID=UPI000484049C|nr:hypothetical protein [Sinorhizobium medicae]